MKKAKLIAPKKGDNYDFANREPRTDLDTTHTRPNVQVNIRKAVQSVIDEWIDSPPWKDEVRTKIVDQIMSAISNNSGNNVQNSEQVSKEWAYRLFVDKTGCPLRIISVEDSIVKFDVKVKRESKWCEKHNIEKIPVSITGYTDEVYCIECFKEELFPARGMV